MLLTLLVSLHLEDYFTRWHSHRLTHLSWGNYNCSIKWCCQIENISRNINKPSINWIDEQHNIMPCPQIIYVILSEQRFDILEYCVWFFFSASVQVFHATTWYSMFSWHLQVYLYFCSLSHNLLCPTAYFIWILKHKLKLGTHSIRGNLTKLLTQLVYEVFPCGDNITKYERIFIYAHHHQQIGRTFSSGIFYVLIPMVYFWK